MSRKITLRAPDTPPPQAESAAAPAPEAHAATATEAQAEASKAPRIFLVNPKEGDEATPAPQASQPAYLGDSAPLPRSGLRRKRQRAAPVEVIYRAEPRPPRPAATGQNALALDGLLDGLDPVFAQIQAAMAFRVDDPGLAGQWEPLSKALDEIAARIRAEMPA
ncbi:hypothetical protein [Rubrivivax sp. A210]|uniref:hypothetical protein n=1 Tax=Rubrivivax sp. A210 TaxID=2772301 RepID=UPI001917BBBD|nr:hypothetical protein [Rubrivivax sp. A210]